MKKLKKVESIEIPSIDRVLANTPAESKNFISKALEISHEISLVLAERGLNQKYLAEKLNKAEPEISKWLSGTHNFTIRTITSIETALGQEILVSPHKVRRNIIHYAQIYRASPNSKKSENLPTEKFSVRQTGGQKYEIAA